MHTWVDIATLTKKKNSKGGFVARHASDLLFLPEPGMQVAFVPPQLDAPRNAQVSDVRAIDEKTFDISFCDIPDSVRELLVGCHCLVRRSQVPEEYLVDEQQELLHLQVFDEAGELIGTVSDMVSNPQQELLVIQRADNGRELLLPFVDKFILQLDQQAGVLTVKLPNGLLELQ